MKIGSLAAAAVSVVSLLSAPIAFSQQIKKDTPVVSSDQPGATSVGTVKSGVSAKILERRGFWIKIDAGGLTGWIKISSLQFGNGGASKIALDTGRMTTGNIVSTSAARGMTKGEFLESTPNESALALLKNNVPAADTVMKFSEIGRLVPKKIAALAVPAVSPKPSTESASTKKNSEAQENW
ncbi:MAG: hypothetical protein FJ184_11820 [Gammaproteobacteria bacterium]|nr:hypothetical protein [Gammaproteobacteria bacterium]